MAVQRAGAARALGLGGRARRSWPSLVGIAYPPNALFLIAFGFVLVLLLHFSVAVSRLSDQTKVLAQRLALLEHRQRPDRGAADEDERDDEPEDGAGAGAVPA